MKIKTFSIGGVHPEENHWVSILVPLPNLLSRRATR